MRIVIEDGNQSWVQDVPNDADLSVGRALSNTIIIEDTAASREHCVVERDEELQYWLRDLGSRNGTRLNGRFVSKAKLNPGDRIEIGSTVITFTGPGADGEARAEKLENDLRARRNALRATDASDALLRDPLTNLASYPAVVLELRRLLKPADPETSDVGQPVALIKLDVDYLGLLNDMFGLRAGDEIIRQTGMAIRAAVDEMPHSAPPLVGREGGGKFLIVIPGGGLDQARELAEMARLGVAQRPLEGALRGATLSLSAGIACAPADAKSWDSLMRRGEAALAEAKRSGRDRVMVVPVTHGEDEPRIQTTALRDTRASGLWAASGLWDPKVARGADVPEATAEDADEAGNPIAPLTLTHAGQSILGLVAQALGSDLELEPLLELILGIICETTDARRGFILLRDVSGTGGGAFRLRAALNRDAPGAKYRESAVSQGILREVEKTRSAILVADALADERFKNRDSILTENVRSVIASPILWGQQVVGIIYLDNKSAAGRFSEETRDLLLACSRLVAGPIRRQSLHQAKSTELERARLALARTAESNILRQRRYGNIIGEAAAMKKLFKLLDRLTQSHHPVLIHGESGTGKELVASAVHYNGPRAQGPFIAENCAALSDSLLEAELFGHVKGAFTGADHERVGLVEAAHGGTLFLDEIGEMSERMQAKLLRVLQEGELRPVGAREVRKVDVRLICASHRDLAKMAREGTFREDLYYRIAVMTIDVPPLRERREDIPLLVDFFLSKGAEVEKRRPPNISREALQLLVHYEWPGNVRELENEIKKLLTLVPDEVVPDNLSPKFLGDSTDRPQSALRKLAVTDGADAMLLMIERGKALAEVIEAFEREIIGRILETTGGNRSETARRLGLSRPGLLKKMKRYGIS